MSRRCTSATAYHRDSPGSGAARYRPFMFNLGQGHPRPGRRPIGCYCDRRWARPTEDAKGRSRCGNKPTRPEATLPLPAREPGDGSSRARSEEHTSEVQSLMRNSYAVFCLKKKKTTKTNTLR